MLNKNKTTIVNILNKSLYDNNEIIVYGWVRSRRDSKIGISFLNIHDGSCFQSLQVIASNKLENYASEILHLTSGCSVVVTGLIKTSINNQNNLELKANKIKVLGWVENPHTYPISAKKHSLEYLRTVSHLRSRTNIIGTITRIRHNLVQAIHTFMHQEGFFWIPTPLITASDSEGIGKMFHVSILDLEHLPINKEGKVNYEKDFFGKKSFLTVSGQLNSETYACAMSKVYTCGPTFRAENSNTNRHLAEFWMIEVELAFSDLQDIIVLAESLLKDIVKKILNTCIDDIEFLIGKTKKNIINILNNLVCNNFIEIEYTEAINIIQQNQHKFKNNLTWGADLSTEHERYLTEEYFKNIVVIKNYPKEIKAFYMRLNNDNKTVAAMDILAPGIGEIIGGSQREERLNKLDNNLRNKGLKILDYWWYRDLRRYGTVPHAGFGLGLERLMLFITQMQNIRDVVPFPRYPYNISF